MSKTLRNKVAKVPTSKTKLSLTDIANLAAQGLSTKTETYRAYLEDVTYPVLLKFAEFQEAMDNVLDENLVRNCIQRLDTMDKNAKANGEPGVNTADAINAYRQLLSGYDYDVGHKDYSAIVQNLTAIRILFEKGIEFIDKTGATDVELNPGRVKSTTGEQTISRENKKDLIKATRTDLQTAIKQLNKGIVIGVSLQKLHKDSFDDDGTPIGDIFDDLKSIIEDPVEVEAIKSKTVDVVTGEANLTLEIQESAFNRNARGKFEGYLSNIRANIAQGKFDEAGGKQLLDEMGVSASAIAAMEDSDPLDLAIVKQYTAIANGKKPKRYKASGSRTKKGKVKKGKTAPILKPVKRKIFTKPLVLAGAIKKRESSSDSNTREINKLRNKINRRLPAEVRRNMGRPALENRTSRFSNSAMLTDLRQGPKTLIGKYTYMINPYSTFENEGERQWPTGYNPKPLIAQSIRNLAMQYTEQKFTLRRD